jgi:NADH dehydrogenase [ubiquinone] 1 alpha subcomplex assembly factor 3
MNNIIAPPDPSERQPLIITKFTTRGYHLSDNLVVPGGLVLVNGTPFLWDVDAPKLIKGGTVEDAWKGWEGERFKILELTSPRPGQSTFEGQKLS